MMQHEPYDFEYTSPEEIKNILNKFLKSNFSTDKLTNFIKEVCLEYSELLFFAHKSLNELRDLETLKNALNERFRRYQKVSSSLENELNLLRSQKPVESQVEVQKNNFDSQYHASINELGRIRAQLEAQQKKSQLLKSREESLSSEYESFKTIFTKELMLIKFDLEEVTQQRNALRDQLVEFKFFFQNLCKIY